MINSYHLKPSRVKAVKWTGTNVDEVKGFLKEAFISATEDQVFFHPFADHISSTGLARFATKGDYIFTEDDNRFDRKKTKEFEEMYELD